MRARGAVLAVLLGLVCSSPLLVTPAAGAQEVPVSTTPPTVSGAAVWGQVLRATRGTWDRDVTVTFRWLRDGAPVRGAAGPSYRLGDRDLGRRLSVRVVATATDGTGSRGRAVSAPTTRVERAELVPRRAPGVVGTARYGRTLSATDGRWSAAPTRFRYQWLRGGRPIAGATGRRYVIAPADVGRSLRVEVTAYAQGHRPAAARSAATGVRHRVDVRRTATYSVQTRGRVTASLATFRRQVQQTYDDPRGWRGRGVRFVPVARGGSFTVVLAEARTVPSFSSECSSMWSCRVGRYVVINHTRWQQASPAWNAARESLRDYRHMVVNHETGHWLGKGHASCPRRGALAPVMMQQSKGTQGCRLNPWPTLGELR